MKALAELLVAFLDLLEAQAIAFRRGMVKLVTSLMLVCLAGLALTGGIGFCLWSLYLALVPIFGPPWAAFSVGAGLLIVALALLANAKRLSR